MTDSQWQLSLIGFKGDYTMTLNGQRLTLALDQDRTDTLTIP